ncbi:hypothetical protein ATN84_14225 [Paramesorhizobium deserti]|uniref:NfeD-like C-terminal domain-containing protein n=1 Tax=Paramesorhizobium deserti TaxID=1494590 RepID=A0A135HS98_9HYPH|nr:NfeD family protein [Paramesorhizobium deserti]KXF76071.1 hypothetical protein ATN84_14225 [Paramesorhizobium deserti]
MIADIVSQLGAWNWIVLGIVLLLLELLTPGIFFVWLGIAALIVGALALFPGTVLGFGWQAQIILFLVLSVVSVLIGRRYFSSESEESDQPLLNRRGEQLIGQTATLKEPIVDGHGRIRLGDTLWRVKGPDMKTGTRVRVTGFEEGTLVVEAE